METVFFGGGTPGLLTAKDLDRLCTAVRRACPQPPAEWTIELAPSTVKADKLRVLRDHGVNRFSVGVQSFQPVWLEALGRQHSLQQVNQALEFLHKAECANINLDLMFAFPGQTLADWETDLNEAICRSPQHLSTYCLTFEEDTKLWLRLSRGEIRQLDEDTEARFYLTARDVLAAGGYEQYEISNFARPGFACRHNLHTWSMHEWIGYGPAAASQYQNRRWQNVDDLDQWAAAIEEGRRPETEVLPLNPETLALDRLVFGLRMNQGVVPEEILPALPPETATCVQELLNRLVGEGFAIEEGANFRLTREGSLVADAIGSEILALPTESVNPV